MAVKSLPVSHKPVIKSKLRSSLRVKYSSELPSLTEPLHARELDINNIVATYRKTKTLPNMYDPKDAIYADVSQFSDFNESMIHLKNMEQKFLSLPSEIRLLAKNNPQFLEQLLVEHQKTLESQNANQNANSNANQNANLNPEPKQSPPPAPKAKEGE